MQKNTKPAAKEQVRILGIAPYPGMLALMEKLAGERRDILLEAHLGDLGSGLSIVQKKEPRDYDVIISRGGTAELIGRESRIPVIEISLSVYDVLRAIKLAEHYAGKYAVVGFPSITSTARLLCDLLLYDIDIFPIQDEREVAPLLTRLRQEEYGMVLCDMITNTTAKSLGLNAILITSGEESITTAFEQAVKLYGGYAHLKEENRFLYRVIRDQAQPTLILEEGGGVFLSSLEGEEEDEILPLLREELSLLSENRTNKFFKTVNSHLYAVVLRILPLQGKRFFIFTITKSNVPMANSKYGIQYSNYKDMEEHFFNSFFQVSSGHRPIASSIEHLQSIPTPVLISGEEGTGKEQAARAIYAGSRLKENPLITINCALLNEKSWHYITNHYNSPLNDNQNTIYFKDLGALEEEKLRQLLSILVDINLCARNRVLFSCISEARENLPKYAGRYINTLACVHLSLPPLRQYREDIPTLTSLHLSRLNVAMSSRIIGLDPGALELLTAYDWPGNYSQLKRFIDELALLTDTSYIREESVLALLEKERKSLPFSEGKGGLDKGLLIDTKKSLSQIIQDVIVHVLEEANGNQSLAAKQLGISRTTLWRTLKG